jgi:sigma-B regulation protein RsbU (phosphoserine phosphatase)
VTRDQALLEDSAELLFEEAPCGYLTTHLDGTILRVNRTFEALTGHRREDLIRRRRFQELLAPAAQIYHETHFGPLLLLQGAIREVAVELVRADGSRLPALVNADLRRDAAGEPRGIRTMVFDATDRRRYERELLDARRREQEVALRLQRSLLVGELPAADGLALDVLYRPAERGLEAGGDWWDAFWVRDGATVALVVGDVVGRGIEAAAAMGQLRSAVRAFASTGLGPAALLEALDGYARRHDLGQMTTVVHAELDLRARRLRYACAGHPPPLLVAPGAEPVLLWKGRSLPVDAFTAIAASRREAALDLPAGATVLLYTDGLVERRDVSLTPQLERLTALAGEHRDLPLDGFTGALVRAFHDPAAALDDVCLLAARVA